MKTNVRIINSTHKAASGRESAPVPRTGARADTAPTGVRRIYGEWIMLCAGLCLCFLLLLTSGDSIRSISESDGIGALSSSLRSFISANDSVAVFFGLDCESSESEAPATEQDAGAETDEGEGQSEDVPTFSFTGGISADDYIEKYNAENYKTSGVIPVMGRVSSPYSFRRNPFFGVYEDEDEYEFHSGIDIAADGGTEILCYLDGVVETRALSADYGYYLCIDHGNGLKTLYAHASELFCYEGDRVARGQVIGLVGDTGRATGTHLHFEVYEDGETVDPEKYLSSLLELGGRV